MLPEISQYLDTLDDLRAQVGGIIKDVPAEGLNWRPPLPADAAADADGTNSLAVLAVHVAGSEHFWFAETIGMAPATRVREAEFSYVATSPEDALERLGAVAIETHAVFSKLTAADLDSSFMKDDHAIGVRWVIHHVLYHYSLHIGHMQLTYQLWNKGKATNSPRWYHRLARKAPHA
jgi:hypothetical protein